MKIYKGSLLFFLHMYIQKVLMLYKYYYNINTINYNKLTEHTTSILFNMHTANVYNEHYVHYKVQLWYSYRARIK